MEVENLVTHSLLYRTRKDIFFQFIKLALIVINDLCRYVILPFCSSCTPPGGKVTENKTHRMINTEEKAKVVAAVWETEFIQCLVLSILLYDNLKNRMNFIRMN